MMTTLAEGERVRLGTIWVVLLVIAVAVVVLGLVAKSKSGGGAARRFKAKALMTPNELEFLGRLEAAVPELRFHCQVAMGALLDPQTPKREDARAHMSARGMFSQKIVDFVAQHRSTARLLRSSSWTIERITRPRTRAGMQCCGRPTTKSSVGSRRRSRTIERFGKHSLSQGGRLPARR